MTELIIKNSILLTAGILNLAMSLFIISRGWKNKVNLYFSLFTFFNFLWALSILLARILESDFYFFWAMLAYPISLGIAVSLFYFSVYFPFSRQSLKKYVHFLILIPGIILSIIFFIPDLFIVSSTHNPEITEYTLYYFKPMYWVFAVYFLILMISVVYNLYIKYKLVELIFKKQIIFLLITIIIGLIFAIYFDLIICYFGDFRYAWAGPPFSLLINAVVFYLIFSARDKINVKE